MPHRQWCAGLDRPAISNVSIHAGIMMLTFPHAGGVKNTRSATALSDFVLVKLCEDCHGIYIMKHSW